MNGYLAVVLNISVGNTHAHNVYGSVTNINKIKSTSRTMAMLEAADNENSTDHVHSYDWFSAEPAHIFDQVTSEVAVERHLHVGANYLFLDGHVESIPSAKIQEWCSQSFNFAKPQK